MQNTKRLLTSLSLLGLLALAGCSFPGVYKIDVQQGNVVTQGMVDQLRPGMTRSQVRYIMGNPLITDTFNANRWDYVYSIQPGGGERTQERINLIFQNDQLAGLSGDFVPGVSRDQAILGQDNTIEQVLAPVLAPVTQEYETPRADSTLEQIQQEIDNARSVPVPLPEPLETSEQ